MARSAQGAPSYLGGGNTPGSPQKGLASPVGKSRSMQNMGNYTGYRAAGLTKSIGDNEETQMRHAFNHYGKPKESGLKDL